MDESPSRWGAVKGVEESETGAAMEHDRRAFICPQKNEHKEGKDRGITTHVTENLGLHPKIQRGCNGNQRQARRPTRGSDKDFHILGTPAFHSVCIQ